MAFSDRVRQLIAAWLSRSRAFQATGKALPDGLKRRIAGGTFIMCLMTSLAIRVLRKRANTRLQEVLPVSLSAVMRLLDEKNIRELVYSDNGSVFARLRGGNGTRGRVYSSRLVPGCERTLFSAAAKSNVVCRYAPEARGPAQLVSLMVPFAFLFIWYRIVKSMMNKEEKFRPSRNSRDQKVPDTTFDDVISKSKIELAEIVDYINHPNKYRAVGARIPRGALLVGPSGTGKTLLARAVAGEARCAFISASAAEFVEVYVGRGAARIRDLFRQARSSAPAVLFLDELDALGTRQRNGLGSNDEYVQTLNQLLTELDGIHGHSDGVVVLAATNRHEAIDSALLRPGRFDRHVFVELPDEGDRLKILTLCASRTSAVEVFANEASPAGKDVLAAVAAASEGFSGAELENLINEAVFLALRNDRQVVNRQDLQASLERARQVRRRSGLDSSPAAAEVAAGLPRASFFFRNANMTPVAVSR